MSDTFIDSDNNSDLPIDDIEQSTEDTAGDIDAPTSDESGALTGITDNDNQVADVSPSGAADQAPKPPASSKARDKTLVRKTVRKTLDVQTSESSVLGIAAQLLGKDSDDIEGIVTAILTGTSRKHLQPISDLKDLKASDPIEVSANATALGRERLKTIWSLLEDLGKAKGNLPAGVVQAAVQTSKAVVNDVTDDELLTLESVTELLKKA